MKSLKKIFLILVTSAFLFGCGNNSSNNKPLDNPTSGNVKVCVEESYKLLFDTEIYTFESFYKNAKINITYKAEGDVLSDFFNDSVKVIVSSRKLKKYEEEKLINNKIIPRTTKIAYDALAFIVNKDNDEKSLTYSQVKKIFKGEISNWKDINKTSKLKDLLVVFDNNKSCNPRYIKEKLDLKNPFPKNCFAVNSNDEVINYVEKNKNAIGIISINWISSVQDSLSKSFLKRINVLAIGTESEGDPVKPFQGYIAEGSYPFTRDVYMIKRETYDGLGSGFVSFVAGEKGQRIILKSGLVPATMPIRLVEIKK